MEENKMLDYIKAVLENIPTDWLRLTTHRLDLYKEELAKTQFIEQLEQLFQTNNTSRAALAELPTAFDYIRLGHPLSCVLEWFIAKQHNINAHQVISFSSKTAPILAILRKNTLDGKATRILYTDKLPEHFDLNRLRSVYGYKAELEQVKRGAAITPFEGSTIFALEKENINQFDIYAHIDFYVNFNDRLGSIILVNGSENADYVGEIQHVRRRETIAMTPANCHIALKHIADARSEHKTTRIEEDKTAVLDTIKSITDTKSTPLVASSGLSIQYAIMMGLIDHALEKHTGKKIKFIVPPNCYGGTNDQARRVAACLDQVEIVDLPVDGDNNMVQSISRILDQLAKQDAIPYIIAEIPTNPRVEVPDLIELKEILETKRQTIEGKEAIEPVFILDQTFCPNVHFLGAHKVLSGIPAISYASGSKFPSGGLCTAGYCAANEKAASLMNKIESHLNLCDNEATNLQYEILAQQLPSMNERIHGAYKNTRAFVNFIQESLPNAKINFVSEELADKGFTPSVFSLDLPTEGDTDEERESYKRTLNHKLINLMISKIPHESKYCVSYGQLKGCYWTIPATSTQGTTKEGDKDYIARVAVSANFDLDLHCQVFAEFVSSL